MNLCIVTSVYRLRKTRPLDYYLKPAVHLLQDFSESDVSVVLFTNLDVELFPEASNIHIIKKDPSSFMDEMSDDPSWKEKYQFALRNRPTNRFEEKVLPDLVSIWMGKMIMMEEAAKISDVVLWQDSGIRMGRVFGKDASRYVKCTSSVNRYISTVESLIKKNSLVFMSCDGYINPYHGVDMTKYGNGQMVRAGFILASSSEVPLLKNKMKSYWNKLAENNDFGTEENPLTLYRWERKDSGILSYDEWLANLGLVRFGIKM